MIYRKKKTTDGTEYTHQLRAHEHEYAHRHNEIHNGIEGAGKKLGPTFIVLCSISNRKITDGTGYSQQLSA